jgi:hypothetical protein
VIDFRYHLVSIVAVFLALAIGIVVGATALKPAATEALDRASKLEKHQINSLHAQNTLLQGQVNSDRAFAQASASRLVGGLLSGQRVVLVTAPGADGSTVSGVTAMLEQAGAKVTGQVNLQPAFFDTSASTQNSLDALAQRLAPLDVTSSGQASQLGTDTQIAGQQQAGQVIANALVDTDGAGLPAATTNDVLSGFAQAGYLQLNPASGASKLTQATLAVEVIPASPPQAGDNDPENLALISLAQQLSQASRGALMAGKLAGSGSGSAIDELNNGSTGVQLSSVDDADTEIGQIVVAQVLANLLAGHKPAAYGVAPGAAPSPAPTATPTPTPTVSASPTPTPGKNKSHG